MGGVSVRLFEIGREVIEACQRGDREAFRALYETYKDRCIPWRFRPSAATPPPPAT
jgi:hypothetical protein